MTFFKIPDDQIEAVQGKITADSEARLEGVKPLFVNESEIAWDWAQFLIEEACFRSVHYNEPWDVDMTVSLIPEFARAMDRTATRFIPDFPYSTGSEDRPFYRGFFAMKGLWGVPEYEKFKDDEFMHDIILQEDVKFAAFIALANAEYRDGFKSAFADWLQGFKQYWPDYAAELGV